MASSVINRREYMKYIRASHPKVFISSPQIYNVASVCLSELLVRANGDSAPSKAKCLKITEKVSVNIMSYVLSGLKIIKNAKEFIWRVFEK